MAIEMIREIAVVPKSGDPNTAAKREHDARQDEALPHQSRNAVTRQDVKFKEHREHTAESEKRGDHPVRRAGDSVCSEEKTECDDADDPCDEVQRLAASR